MLEVKCIDACTYKLEDQQFIHYITNKTFYEKYLNTYEWIEQNILKLLNTLEELEQTVTLIIITYITSGQAIFTILIIRLIIGCILGLRNKRQVYKIKTKAKKEREERKILKRLNNPNRYYGRHTYIE